MPGVNLCEQCREDAFALLIRDPVDLCGAEMALERLDHDRGRYIHLGTQAVTEDAQALLEGDLQAVLSGLRPEANAGQGEPAPGKQFARIEFAGRRHIGMTKNARTRDRMTVDDLLREMNHRFDLRVGKRAIAE